jgi:hypothetical protein
MGQRNQKRHSLCHADVQVYLLLLCQLQSVCDCLAMVKRWVQFCASQHSLPLHLVQAAQQSGQKAEGSAAVHDGHQCLLCSIR